jgi:hypothetical protein
MEYNLTVKKIARESYILSGKIENKTILDNLKNFVKNNKDEKFSYQTNVKAHFTGFKSLNNNIDFVNFITLIKPYIFKIWQEGFTIKDAWGNVCKINDEVTKHNHRGTSAFCGVLYLTDTNHFTYFEDYDLKVKDEAGKFLLFDPYTYHSVPKITEEMERITIAFNMNELHEWEHLWGDKIML